MRATFKFLLALIVATLFMLVFRALAFTIYTVDGSELEPDLQKGDRVMVNRWSYGLRTGGDNGLFRYDRIFRSAVEKGDIVAFDSPKDSLPGVFVCRCKSVPGDTVRAGGETLIVPGLVTCAKENYYWMESLNANSLIDSRYFGFVPESCIIGRVCMIVYSHDDDLPFYEGYRAERMFGLLE